MLYSRIYTLICTQWNDDIYSEFYSTDERLINNNDHALMKFTVTYTLGFGKKVNRDNEPKISGSAESGILK